MKKKLTKTEIDSLSFNTRNIIDKVFKYNINLYDSGQLSKNLNSMVYENSEVGVSIEDFLWEEYGANDPDLIDMSREKEGYSVIASYYYGEEDEGEVVEACLFYDESFRLKKIEVNFFDSGKYDIWEYKNEI